MGKTRVLFVGLGSIGRRHLGNLRSVFEERGRRVEVEALRHAVSALPSEVSAMISRQHVNAANLRDDYDMVFVCNPSQMHVDTLLELRDKGKFFFVEKPVSVAPIPEATMESLGDPSRYVVACPLRHSAMYAAIREFVAGSRVLSAEARCSSYLPDWRPGVDYSSLYSARRDSGGVKIDLIHEFDYLFSLFGIPTTSNLVEAKVSSLKIDCPDVALYSGISDGVALQVHLDYFGRKPDRTLRLCTADDVVEFDFISGRRRNLTSGVVEQVGDFDRNAMYLREMKSFVDCAEGKALNINDLRFANSVLAAVCGK